MLSRMLCSSPNLSNRLSASSSKFMKPSSHSGHPSAGLTTQQTNCFSTSSSCSWQAAPPGRPKVITITGPTAVGKTKLGLELAKRIGGEIISADSVQVYKGLDIGSDKLPVAQREGIPHHLLDVLPPDAEFSAGDFHQLGRKAAEDIIARGKTPIVVGGTGFYLRWFIYGKAATPASNPETAAKALAMVEQAWQQAAAAAAAAVVQQQAAVAAAAATAGQVQAPAGTQQQQQPQHQQQWWQWWRHWWRGSSKSQVGQASTQQLQGSLLLQQQQQQQGPDTLAVDVAGQQHSQVGKPQPPAVAAAAAAGTGLGPACPTPGPDVAALLTPEQRWDIAVDLVAQLGDAATAARIRAERNNWYRLQRVLQILLQNGGKPLSEADIDTEKPLDYDFRCFFMTRPRLELYDRIAYRVEEMVESGLLPEALMLLDLGLTPNSHVATRAIGYRQACEFMQAALRDGGASKEQLQQLILGIARASRNLVKNQTTWFRDDTLFRWLEVGGRSTENVLQELLAELDKTQHEGGCGDSGRLDKETQRALKQYVPTLKLFCDDARVERTLEWVRQSVATRRLQQPVH